MKKKLLLRCLALVLSGAMVLGSPVQLLAAETNKVVSEAEDMQDMQDLQREPLNEPSDNLEEPVDNPESSNELSDNPKEPIDTPEIVEPSDSSESSNEPSDNLEEPVDNPESSNEPSDTPEESIDTPEIVEPSDSSVSSNEPSDTPEEPIDTPENSENPINNPNDSENLSVVVEEETLKESAVTSIVIDPNSVVLNVGQKKQLKATAYSGAGSVSASLNWSISDSSIASLEAGLLTAKKAGTATVTVWDSNGIKATCSVRVIIPISSVSLNQNNLSLKRGQTAKLVATVSPSNTTESKSVSWASSNSNIISVDALGNVTAKGVGNAVITVTTSNGLKAACDVTVVQQEYKTGWQYVNGLWYYYNTNGDMQTGWQTIGAGRYYFAGNGVMQTGWQYVGGSWYYLNENGAMQTGWLLLNNVWYYLNKNGIMQTSWQLIDNVWYYFAGNGVMQTGWLNLGNAWYFLNDNGSMRTGWLESGNIWYYLGDSGSIKTGWQLVGNTWYYMDENGVMQTGWLYLGSTYYYLNDSGAMQTGWLKTGSSEYYFASNGAMWTGWLKLNDNWYYMNANGKMQTGWLKLDGYWYYMNSKGIMVDKNTKIDGKWNRFESNGVWKGVVSENIKAFGIDVSSNQGSIDWKKVADDNIDFAMLRVVVGKTSKMERDAKFKEYYNGARDAGIKVGVYRYSYATSRTKARQEAQAVIDALNGRKLDYPVVLDMEDSSILENTSSNAKRSEIILAFKEEIEKAGYDFALYANITWLNKYLDMNMLDDVDIWVARWRDLDRGHGYDGKVTMWQYSNNGNIDGISGKVDLNVSYKSY